MKKYVWVAGLLCAAVTLALCACVKASVQSEADTSVQSEAASAPVPTTPPVITLSPGANPLTGLALAADAPSGVRPLAVMVDNVKAALPQRGLAAADLVYEMVTESGITRLMAVYSNPAEMPAVGPVRSARDQHVQLMLPLGADYLHVGGSTYANEMLAKYRYETKSLNGMVQTDVLALDSDRNALTSIEHCWFTSGALYTAAAQNDALDTVAHEVLPAFQFMPYTGAPRVLIDGDAVRVSVRFSSYTNTVFTYDAASNRYRKAQFGADQIDENTGETVSFDNVLILFTDITKYPDGILAQVDYAFGGVGFYVNGGRYEKVRWMKGAPESPLRIVALDGTETPVSINPGTSYVAMVDLSKYPYFKMSATEEASVPESDVPLQDADAQESPDDT
ncbi:MAG: DUF3048 domain-containing protein [Ruthenibacterium sp.]